MPANAKTQKNEGSNLTERNHDTDGITKPVAKTQSTEIEDSVNVTQIYTAPE